MSLSLNYIWLASDVLQTSQASQLFRLIKRCLLAETYFSIRGRCCDGWPLDPWSFNRKVQMPSCHIYTLHTFSFAQGQASTIRNCVCSNTAPERANNGHKTFTKAISKLAIYGNYDWKKTCTCIVRTSHCVGHLAKTQLVYRRMMGAVR